MTRFWTTYRSQCGEMTPFPTVWSQLATCATTGRRRRRAAARNGTALAGWTFESYDYNGWSATGGACAEGTQAVRRVYNGRWQENDSNHRYLTSPSLYAEMLRYNGLPVP